MRHFAPSSRPFASGNAPGSRSSKPGACTASRPRRARSPSLRRPIQALLALWVAPVAAILFLPAAASAGLQAEGAGAADPAPVVIYLVRHAEKADNGTDDPPLTLAGEIRVRVLKHLLAGIDIAHIHSTDTRRTRETARPIAQARGIEVALYDPADPAGFAAQLAAMPGSHLVVGHSNTTPGLVAALGGSPGGPIDEWEYDRLYQVVIHPGQPPLTTVLRFGEPFSPGSDFGLRFTPSGRVGGPSGR